MRDIVSYLKLALNPHDSVALPQSHHTSGARTGQADLTTRTAAPRLRRLTRETIAILTERAKGSGAALSRLKNFQNIVTGLVALAPRATAPKWSRRRFSITCYAYGVKTENTEEAEGRLRIFRNSSTPPVDYDAQEEGGVGGLRDFIDAAALVSDTVNIGRTPVTLMTVHSARALEFQLVFIVGWKTVCSPHARSVADRADWKKNVASATSRSRAPNAFSMSRTDEAAHLRRGAGLEPSQCL